MLQVSLGLLAALPSGGLCSLCQEGYHLLQLLVHLLSHLSTKNFLLTVSEKSKNEILLVLMGPVPSLNDD